MKKTILFTVLFLFVFASQILAFVLVRAGNHWHTNWSDGYQTAWMTKEFALSDNLDVVVFNDHSDLKIRTTSGGYRKYKKEIEGLSDPDFIAIAGLEISIVKSDNPNPKKLPKTLCHMGWIGDSDNPWIYDSRYDWNNVAEVIKIACSSFADSACIAHHLKECKVWADYQYLSHFSGMELFNDLGFEKNYVFHRDTYLSAQAKGWRGYATVGDDTHNYIAQSALGDFVMYVCAEEFTREAIEKGIFEGRTIATGNLKIKSLNICPATVTQEVEGDSFEIKGTVEIEKSNVPVKNLTIYKDGIYYKNIALKLKRNITVLNSEYDFNFSDTISSSQDSCYILEIYRYMITSPFCFRQDQPLLPEIPNVGNSEDIEPTMPKQIPNKVFRVTSVKHDQMFYRTEKEGLNHPYVLGSAFEYCYKDFATTPDGFIFGCKNPLMIKGVSDGEDGDVLYYSSEILKPINEEEAFKKVEKSFAIALGKNEYKCMTDQFQHHIILSAEKNIKSGDKFYVCDPDGPIFYNKEDESISCDKTCYGEASYPGMSNFWNFQKLSGDCPIDKLGSVWLVPK